VAERSATLVSRQVLAPGVHLLRFAVDGEPLTFRAGQFVSVRCGEGGDVRRSYTIVSPPADGAAMDLLIKDVDGGVGTALFTGLEPGQAIHFTGPVGFFVADPAHPGDVVHVITGAGLAASLPVLEDTLARREAGRVIALWGQPDGQARYLQDRVAAVRAHARSTWENLGGPDWPGVHERLTARVLELLPDLDRPVFYTVGNGDMIRRVREALVAAGVDRRKQIRNEVFYPVMEGQK
jgi:ferredoxin-NADP reductase